jgi:hypothetical protein
VFCFLCCDRGTAYLHNVFDDAWAASRNQEEDAAITAGIHG